MPVKAHLSHRQRQAQATRATVARAARRVFAESGYVSTTIEMISQAADIPTPTIYSAFGNKPAILEEVRRLWILETDVAELHRRAVSEPDPRQALRLAAHWTRRQFELGYEVIAIYLEAARADHRVAAVWQNVMQGREAAVSELIRSLKPHLRLRLTSAHALDLYVTATLPEAFRTLVIERGWSLNRFEGWLAEVLIWELLGE